MQENLLHFIWQFQYFAKKPLLTTEGEELTIIHPGIPNSDAGPDFIDAKILIGNVQWFGRIEIHIFSSGWEKHGHLIDPAYDNVILHVVWKNDTPIKRTDGSFIPTLELLDKADEAILLKWQNFTKTENEIACSSQIGEVKDLVRLSMMDKAFFERLQSKANTIIKKLAVNDNDWEEIAYQLVFANFGFKINSEPFSELGRLVPYKIILKHQDNLTQIEALLFGQAGLLNDEGLEDEYFQSLKKEFAFLKHKYSLPEGNLPVYEWKFLRLRPANFPTIRIAQLAMLLHKKNKLFSTIKEAETPKDVFTQFSVIQSPYWQKHYHFSKKSKGKVPGLGKSSIENLMINTIVPLLAAYGIAKNEQYYIDKSVEFLQYVPAENNKIIRIWENVGIKIKSAFDSQALIQLYNHYCKQKRCLSCSIGTTILKKAKA